MDLTSAFAGMIWTIVLVCLLIGLALGGFFFEVLPWLYHHISFSWAA